VHRNIIDGGSGDLHTAGVVDQPGDCAKQRGLSPTTGTQDAYDLSRGDVEVYAVQHRLVVADPDVAQAEH
jgi:hypothetical protein